MERRGLWQTAWGVVATIGAGFDVGLSVARTTSDTPVVAIIAASVVMLVALYFVFAPVFHRWPFTRPDTPPADPPPPEPAAIDLEDSLGEFPGLKVRGYERAIKARDSEIYAPDADIEKS